MTKTTEPPRGWTVDTYVFHNEAMRIADKAFDEERDRRNVEIGIEREKALKIKETADRDAMSLARDAQTYKEKQNDALREKTLGESGIYATNASVASAIDKLQATLQPLANYVNAQQGASKNSDGTWSKALGVLGLLFGLYIAAKNGVKL